MSSTPTSGSGSLRVNDRLPFRVDPRLVLAHALPSSGAVTTLFKSTNGMLQLQGQPGSSPSCQVVVRQQRLDLREPRSTGSALLTAFDGFLQKAEALEAAARCSRGRPTRCGRCSRRGFRRRMPRACTSATGCSARTTRPAATSTCSPECGWASSSRSGSSYRRPPGPACSAVSSAGRRSRPTWSAGAVPSGAPRLGLDAFFSAVRLPPVPPAAGGAGGIVDLVAQHRGQLRHLRVCYPARSFPGADDGGTVGAAGNVALLGAPDLATLATATNSYYISGDAGPYLGRLLPRPHRDPRAHPVAGQRHAASLRPGRHDRPPAAGAAPGAAAAARHRGQQRLDRRELQPLPARARRHRAVRRRRLPAADPGRRRRTRLLRRRRAGLPGPGRRRAVAAAVPGSPP